MNEKILVRLRRYDRSEEMISYIQKVARPGMKVVFLIRYPVAGFAWAREQCGTRAALQAKELVDYCSWEGNLAKAKKQVAFACEILRGKGIESAVNVYAGSLKKAVRTHTINGDVHLILTRAGIGQRIVGLIDGSNSLFDLFEWPALSPVLLIHPSMAARGHRRTRKRLSTQTEEPPEPSRSYAYRVHPVADLTRRDVSVEEFARSAWR